MGAWSTCTAFEVKDDHCRVRIASAFDVSQRRLVGGEDWEYSLQWSFSPPGADWMRLPVLVLDIVTSFLDVSSIGCMACVCRSWRYAITEKAPTNMKVLELGREQHRRQEAARHRLDECRRLDQERVQRRLRLISMHQSWW